MDAKDITPLLDRVMHEKFAVLFTLRYGDACTTGSKKERADGNYLIKYDILSDGSISVTSTWNGFIFHPRDVISINWFSADSNIFTDDKSTGQYQ